MTIVRKVTLDNLTIEPEVRISEVQSPQLGERKENEDFRAIVNFQVIEKTRNFVVIRISSVTPFPSKRII